MTSTLPFALAATLAVSLSPTLFAQNDECTGATSVSLGTTAFNTAGSTSSAMPWSCSIAAGADAWYSFTAGMTAQHTIATCGATFDTVLQVFDGSCGALTNLACNDDGCGNQSALTFDAIASQTYLFRIGGYNAATGSGMIDISVFVPSPNDECINALTLVDGQTAFSTVTASNSMPIWPCAVGGSDIWYTFTGTGAQLSVDTCVASFDTCLELFQGGCGSLTSIACDDDTCMLGSEIQVGTVAGQPYYLRLGGVDSTGGTGMLMVSGVGGSGNIGTNYCTPAANGTGVPATMAATGSVSIASNDLTLTANSMPTNVFGFFITGQTQGFVMMPGTSIGNLCLAGAIGRYVGPGQIQNSGPAGAISLQINLTQVPTPGGLVPVMTGETWNFQAWYRDFFNGMATSNFTDGYSITFF